MSKRPVIVHFHLFKNAGSSVDVILQNNFGQHWIEIEGKNNKKLSTDELVQFIRDNPQYKAISSHTAVVSVPILPDIIILPVFFFRHPIDRIRSAYDFERKQIATTPGSLKAKEGDFGHYLDWRLSSRTPWPVSNFHAMRLKDFHQITPERNIQDFQPHARYALMALPLVGLVEQFDESMSRFERFANPYFPNFQIESVRVNTTSDKSLRLSDNLEKFKTRIGPSDFEKLLNVNKIDLLLYNFANQLFKARRPPQTNNVKSKT